MMEQGLLDRAGLAAPDVDELGLPLPLDREPLQALARPPQRLVQRPQPMERPLGVTGDGPDQLSDRSSFDLGPASPAVFVLQEQVIRVGQRRDPAPRLDTGRVPLAERSLQVEAAPLRPDLQAKSGQDRRRGDLLGHPGQELLLLLVGERSGLGPGLPLRPSLPSPSHGFTASCGTSRSSRRGACGSGPSSRVRCRRAGIQSPRHSAYVPSRPGHIPRRCRPPADRTVRRSWP